MLHTLDSPTATFSRPSLNVIIFPANLPSPVQESVEAPLRVSAPRISWSRITGIQHAAVPTETPEEEWKTRLRGSQLPDLSDDSDTEQPYGKADHASEDENHARP